MATRERRVDDPAGAPGAAWAAHLAAAALFVALAIGLTWPLARHLNDALPGIAAGDNVTFVWNLWWTRFALSTGWNLFHTLHLFYPFGVDLTFNTHTAFNGIISATVLAPLPVVAAQNVEIIAAYALNGIAAYALAWTLTRSIPAATTAGVLFMAAPFFATRLHGHFNLLCAWCLPAYAAALLRALDRRSIRAAAVAAAVAVAAMYTEYYFTVYLAVFTVCTFVARSVDMSVRVDRSTRGIGPVDWILFGLALIAIGLAVWIRWAGGTTLYILNVHVSLTTDTNLRVALWVLVLAFLVRRWPLRIDAAWRAGTSPRIDLGLVTLVGAVVVVGALPLIRLAVARWAQGDYVSQPYFWRSAPAGIDALSLFAGNPYHPVWGSLTRRVYDAAGIEPIEQAAWLGLAPIAVLVLWHRMRSRPAGTSFWIGIAAVFGLWALGPSLVVGGIRTGLWLPEVLLRFVPIFNNARMPSRAMAMVYLALAVLSALVVAASPPRRARRMAVALCVVALIDGIAAPFPLYQPQPPAFYGQLVDARRAAVLELPLGLHDGFGDVGRFDPEALLFQTIHERPIFGGMVSRLEPSVRRAHESAPVLRALLHLSAGEPVADPPSTDAVAEFLRDSKTAYVVVSQTLTPPALQDFVDRSMPVTLRAVEYGRALYVVR